MALRFDQDNLKHLENYVNAFKELKAEYVLLLSEPHADKEVTLLGKEFHQVEQLLQQKDMNYTILRTMFFTDNLALYAKDIKSNKRLALPLSKKGYFAPLQAQDVANAVCSILCDCQKHHGQVYEITGPKTKVCTSRRVYTRPTKMTSLDTERRRSCEILVESIGTRHQVPRVLCERVESPAQVPRSIGGQD
jgi:uncharacterized protein YbjT (DUF2867 family)